MTIHLVAKDGCVEFTPSASKKTVMVAVLRDDGTAREKVMLRRHARKLYKSLVAKGYKA
jgi:uncharacterized protein YjhX (UPF0386 family)